jgi:NADPH-dependent 2,4-dienoyl-CoA reductase/sulfur reductase-like enzyme
MARQRIAVIGGVASGPAAAAEAKRQDPDADVVLFERGEFISYSACSMPYFVARWIDDYQRLIANSPTDFERSRGAEVLTRHEVTAIHARRQRLVTRDLRNGEIREHRFDKFILATGARARVPDLDGVEAENFFRLRELSDALALRRYLDVHEVMHAVIFGGGYVGIEAAEALRVRGIRVTILEPQGGLLPGYLDDELRPLVHDAVHRQGIFVRREKAVRLGRDRHDRIEVVHTDHGERIGCQLVLAAIGIRPNVELAAEAGIRIGGSGALAADDQMKTNVPNIWACGDVVEVTRVIDGKKIHAPLAPSAFRTARVAAQNAARKGRGAPSVFVGVCPASAVKVFGLEVASAGLKLNEASEGGFDAFASTVKQWSKASTYPGAAPMHVRMIVERGSGRLLGAEIVGEEGSALRLNVLVPLIREGWSVRDIRDIDLVYTPPIAPSLDPLVVAANAAAKKANQSLLRR